MPHEPADWPSDEHGPAPTRERRVLSVSELNRQARRLLEQDLPVTWITGEISNLARPASGHWYFTLKDEQAQVRCAMFSRANRAVGFAPANGQTVLALGRVSLYEARGEFQVILEQLQPAGDGLLRQRLEALIARLTAEGLFARDRKRPLPRLPRAIGVITSPTGAAIRDILNVLRRRFRCVPVVIYPVSVQGEAAKHEIAAAFATAAARQECDVLILARGGGSLEDLWAFNEELVARAIVASPIPVVAGVGHEVDVTVADLAADLRAPTPSGAAELVVPDSAEWLANVGRLDARAAAAVRRRLQAEHRGVVNLAGRLRRADPGYRLRQGAQRLDELRQRLTTALRQRLSLQALRRSGLSARLRRASPALYVAQAGQRITAIRTRLALAARSKLREQRLRVAAAAGRLGAVSPLPTLERGYAIVRDARGRILRAATAAATGDIITARLASGTLTATITAVEAETRDSLSGARRNPR